MPRMVMLVVPLAVAALVAGCSSPVDDIEVAGGGAICTEHSVTTTISPQDPTEYRMVGWLCLPPTGEAATVQLLVAGLTFSHHYWDPVHRPERYSYVRAANQRGYATFNVDRIGVGKSDRPPANLVTLQAHAHTITRLVSLLRAGGIGGKPFRTVVGVGHSLGAGILQYQAGTAGEPASTPDLLVLSGYLTRTNPEVLAQIGAALYPAAQDPKFAADGLPPGYLTTRPDTRAVFYDPGSVEAGQVSADERWKQTTTLAERATVSAARDPKIMQRIRVPVLVEVGDRDRLACAEQPGLSCKDGDAVLERERDNFGAVCLTVHVVPNTGHAITMSRDPSQAYKDTNDWIDAHIPNATPPSSPACP